MLQFGQMLQKAKNSSNSPKCNPFAKSSLTNFISRVFIFSVKIVATSLQRSSQRERRSKEAGQVSLKTTTPALKRNEMPAVDLGQNVRDTIMVVKNK